MSQLTHSLPSLSEPPHIAPSPQHSQHLKSPNMISFHFVKHEHPQLHVSWHFYKILPSRRGLSPASCKSSGIINISVLPSSSYHNCSSKYEHTVWVPDMMWYSLFSVGWKGIYLSPLNSKGNMSVSVAQVHHILPGFSPLSHSTLGTFGKQLICRMGYWTWYNEECFKLYPLFPLPCYLEETRLKWK